MNYCIGIIQTVDTIHTRKQYNGGIRDYLRCRIGFVRIKQKHGNTMIILTF